MQVIKLVNNDISKYEMKQKFCVQKDCCMYLLQKKQQSCFSQPQNHAVITGKMPCKYEPVFALYLYCIESNRVNTVQKRVRIYRAFFLCMVSS